MSNFFPTAHESKARRNKAKSRYEDSMCRLSLWDYVVLANLHLLIRSASNNRCNMVKITKQFRPVNLSPAVLQYLEAKGYEVESTSFKSLYETVIRWN